jgi:hypothetical protein
MLWWTSFKAEKAPDSDKMPGYLPHSHHIFPHCSDASNGNTLERTKAATSRALAPSAGWANDKRPSGRVKSPSRRTRVAIVHFCTNLMIVIHFSLTPRI